MGKLDNLYKDIVHTFVETDAVQDDNSFTSPSRDFSHKEIKERERGHSSPTKNPSHQIQESKEKRVQVHNSTITQKPNSKQLESENKFSNFHPSNNIINDLKKDNEYVKAKLASYEQTNEQIKNDNKELKKQILEQSNVMISLQKDMQDLRNFLMGSNNKRYVASPSEKSEKSDKSDKQEKEKTYKAPPLNLNLAGVKKIGSGKGSSSKVPLVEKQSSNYNITIPKKIAPSVQINVEEKQVSAKPQNSPISNNDLLTTEEKGILSPDVNNLQTDRLSINSSQLDLDDVNLYYKNSERYSEISVKNSQQIKIPTIPFHGNEVTPLGGTPEQINLTNMPKIKKQFVSERELKNNIENKIQNKLNNERPMDTEYSFSEDYNDKVEDKDNKINFSMKINQQKYPLNINNIQTKKPTIPTLGFGTLANLPKSDFNDEFIEHFDEFSQSWRDACKEINLKKKVDKFDDIIRKKAD